jgi:hypothetical protein
LSLLERTFSQLAEELSAVFTAIKNSDKELVK